MRIQFFSDLHTEDGDIPYEPVDCDVIAILGDIGIGRGLIDWCDKHLANVKQPILVVPGNHDFWYGWMPERLSQFETDLAQMGIDFLYNKSITIQDTLFLGTTLWTDFNLHGQQYNKMLIAKDQMADYQTIWGDSPDGKVTSEDILSEHKKAVEFLNTSLSARPKGQKTAVLTHHPVSELSLGTDKDNRFAPYYASNLDELFLEHQPELVLHGHVHKKVQYFIGEETLVMSNPKGRAGHPKSFNKQFDMRMTVNI